MGDVDNQPDAELPKPRKPVMVGTGMPATGHLEAFGQTLKDAFGAMPYHVGSSIHGKTWRDVDVRIMLDDDRFHALFPGYKTWRQRDAWWALVCAAISELGRVRTGLPIDFQVQATTEANDTFDGPRNALFLPRDGEDYRPEMLPGDGDEPPAEPSWCPDCVHGPNAHRRTTGCIRCTCNYGRGNEERDATA